LSIRPPVIHAAQAVQSDFASAGAVPNRNDGTISLSQTLLTGTTVSLFSFVAPPSFDEFFLNGLFKHWIDSKTAFSRALISRKRSIIEKS
jgi:hypothetical protein